MKCIKLPYGYFKAEWSDFLAFTENFPNNNHLQKLQTFAYLHQQNRATLKVRIFKVKKLLNCHTKSKNQIKMHHEISKLSEPFSLFLDFILFHLFYS